MENFTNGPEMPIGFGMALAKDLNAMNYFSAQSEETQKQMIERAKTISSKNEMESYVRSFTNTEHYF